MSAPLDILLVAIGSYGDVHPFIGIARALRDRGHNTAVAVNPYFQRLVEAEGLAHIPLGTAERYKELTSDPLLWHRRKGSFTVLRYLNETLRPVYDACTAFIEKHPDGIVVAGSLGLGARVAADKFGFPMATAHLAPLCFRSIYSIPKGPGLFMLEWMPPWMREKAWETADRFIIDPILARELNAFRHSLGLPPRRRFLHDWWNAPDLTLGLFPDWFCPPQPDWPTQARLTTFPLYDESSIGDLPTDLVRFLDAGPAPVAFTPGSAMRFGREFFEQSAAACTRAGLRGLLLTRYAEQLPPSLPPGVIHVPYAPFSKLLPRCAALVHHGGIGTTSQALRAGIPQIIMPMAHDQFDNAHRITRLGVGGSIPCSRYRAKRLAGLLTSLTTSAAVGDACQAIRRRFDNIDPLAETCDLIESLPARKLPQVAANL